LASLRRDSGDQRARPQWPFSGDYVTFTDPKPQEFSKVPIQNFLSMSGGLRDMGTGKMDWEQILNLSLHDGAQYTPGTENLYSNPSFMLMGRLIQTVTSENYGPFMQDNVLGANALDLPDTIVHDGENTPKSLAIGYDWNGSAYTPATLRPPISSFSSSAMLSSASGLAQYMMSIDQQLILSSGAYTALFTQAPSGAGPRLHQLRVSRESDLLGRSAGRVGKE
jgi:CubicO group peptidase (beta-lactamase class C family)